MKKYLNYFLCTAFAAAVMTAHPAAGDDPFEHMTTMLNQADQIDRDGETALASGDAITAEAKSREAIAFEEANTRVRTATFSYDLAEALTAQGRTVEAMQVYQQSVQMPYRVGGAPQPDDCNALLRYSLLLSQSGHWAEAVAKLNAALPAFHEGDDRPTIGVSLDPSVPQPTALAAVAHVALGVDLMSYSDSRGVVDNQKAQSEFAKALELAPDWDVANYYYAYGLRHLGQTQQANAAFEKTVKMAKGAVKTAAELALKNQKKPV